MSSLCNGDTIRLVEKARRTVRGSADDIGWLQRDPHMPPVEDGTIRFMEILDSIRCNSYLPFISFMLFVVQILIFLKLFYFIFFCYQAWCPQASEVNDLFIDSRY